jgi:hypothetical protein
MSGRLLHHGRRCLFVRSVGVACCLRGPRSERSETDVRPSGHIIARFRAHFNNTREQAHVVRSHTYRYGTWSEYNDEYNRVEGST